MPAAAPRMAAVERFFRIVDSAALAIANTALVVLLLTICWNVLSRYVMRSPVAWAGDITTIAFAWFIFIGVIAVHDRRGHISIDMLPLLFPGAARYLEKTVDLFVAVFCFYTAYLCALQAIISQGTAHTTVLKIPLSVLFVSLAAGFLLMAVRSVGYLLGVRPPVAED